MKAILEFDLSDRDDAKAHYGACRAFDTACALFDIEQLLFRDEIEDIEFFKKEIREIYKEYNIVVNKLID